MTIYCHTGCQWVVQHIHIDQWWRRYSRMLYSWQEHRFRFFRVDDESFLTKPCVWTLNRQFEGWWLHHWWPVSMGQRTDVCHLHTDWEIHWICLQYKQREKCRCQNRGLSTLPCDTAHEQSVMAHGWTESGQLHRTWSSFQPFPSHQSCIGIK